MKRNTKYVGLDVHQAMTVATVRGQGGRVIARSVIETGDASEPVNDNGTLYGIN